MNMGELPTRLEWFATGEVTMTIFHLDIEAFMTAVEQVVDPQLRDRPLVVAPPGSRATVMAASPRAKDMGITRGMSMRTVRERFRDVRIMPPNQKRYVKANRHVVHLAQQLSPIVEPVGFGHVVLDMRGTERLHGSYASAALILCRDVAKSVRLQGTIGIGPNKLVSGIVAKEVQKHRELLHHVVAGDEARFLAPLSCKALPEWREEAVRHALFELNLARIGDIQALPQDLVSFAVGASGPRLHRHAHGIDPSPVTPPRQTRHLQVKHAFQPDSNDDRVIQATLFRMLERACTQMRAKDLGCERVFLELRFTDDIWRQRRVRVPLTQSEHALYDALVACYPRWCDRRQRVRFLRLTLEGLAPYYEQPSLFEQPQKQGLQRHLDRIRQRFGETAIQLGRGFAGQQLHLT